MFSLLIFTFFNSFIFFVTGLIISFFSHFDTFLRC